VESMETPAVDEIVTSRGTGLGKVESKTDWESRKSSEPKWDGREANLDGPRMESMQGDRTVVTEGAGGGRARKVPSWSVVKRT
jgi:hypothetical protein